MRTKNAILFICSIVPLYFTSFSCAGKNNMNNIADFVKPANIEEAFADVVKVLHAPYEKKDLFFKIFTGDTETHEVKNGFASAKIGESDSTGKGIWSVKAGAKNTAGIAGGGGKNNNIVYEYREYQPKGSYIHVTGKMIGIYRSKNTTENTDAIGFNKNPLGISGVAMAILVNTLKINGAYKASLIFTYPYGFTHSDVTESNYDEFLFGDSKGMFHNNKHASTISKIEFTYEDQAITLNKEQLKTLLHVA